MEVYEKKVKSFKVEFETPFGLNREEMYFWAEFKHLPFALIHTKIAVHPSSVVVHFEPVLGQLESILDSLSDQQSILVSKALSTFLSSLSLISENKLNFLFLTPSLELKYFNPIFFSAFEERKIFIDGFLFDPPNLRKYFLTPNQALKYFFQSLPSKKTLDSTNYSSESSSSGQRDFMIDNFSVTKPHHKQKNMIKNVPNRVKLPIKHSFKKVWSFSRFKESEANLYNLTREIRFQFGKKRIYEDELLKLLYKKNFNSDKLIVYLTKSSKKNALFPIKYYKLHKYLLYAFLKALSLFYLGNTFFIW